MWGWIYLKESRKLDAAEGFICRNSIPASVSESAVQRNEDGVTNNHPWIGKQDVSFVGFV